MHEEQRVMEGRYNLPYNWIYQPSDRHWRGKNGLWTVAKQLAGDIEGKHVLDAGCGDGWYSARMIDKGGVVSGVDLSERAIGFAKQILPRGEFHAGSLVKLPYKDKLFDIIFSFQVLEHIPLREFPAVLNELSRVLKDDGIFIASVPSVNRPLSKAHFRHFTAATITDALRPAFMVENVLGQEKATPLLRGIELFLENRFWLFSALAEKFHRAWYLGHFNRASASRAKNLVVSAKKSPRA